MMKKTLILGLGNPILTDDGVGIRVVHALRARTLPAGVFFAEAGVGGLRLLETIAGYERVILVDAILNPKGRPGEICLLQPRDLRTSLHSGSAHDLSFSDALNLGRELGMDIPEDPHIKIVAIQVEDVQTLGEEMTPAVEASITGAVEAVLEVLREEKGSS
jgi:hydrogenase maturation protease